MEFSVGDTVKFKSREYFRNHSGEPKFSVLMDYLCDQVFHIQNINEFGRVISIEGIEIDDNHCPNTRCSDGHKRWGIGTWMIEPYRDRDLKENDITELLFDN